MDSGLWRGWRSEEQEREDKSQDRTSLTGSWHDHLPPQIKRGEDCSKVNATVLCGPVVHLESHVSGPVLLTEARHRPWPHSRSQTPGMRIMGSPDESVCHNRGGQPVGLLSPKITAFSKSSLPWQPCMCPDNTVWPVGRDLAPGKTILLFPGFWHWDVQRAS